MALIYYSVAGEGRGHATRARTIVEDLRKRHEIVIFSSGVAYEFLAKCYRDSDVRVQRIPGLLFHYSKGRLNYLKTTWEGLKYLARMESLVRFLEKMIRLGDADLAITDFEPALPRAARRCGVPVISLDHQHFLTVSDLSSLPWNLRLPALLSEPLVEAYCHGQSDTIVSSFYFPPLRKQCEGKVIQAGAMLRPDIVERRPTQQGYVVAYLRTNSPENVRQALLRLDREVRVYGLGERAAESNLRFLPVSEAGFLDDLTGCDALITNAGNQLLGEALFLGKPIFALPEPRQFEQFINAHFLRDSGGGDWCEVHQVGNDTFRNFLARRDEFVCRIDRKKLHGNPLAIETIENRLRTCKRFPVTTRATVLDHLPGGGGGQLGVRPAANV